MTLQDKIDKAFNIDIEKVKKPPTIKEQTFIREYISNGYNATRAYMKISPNCTYDTARSNGAKLLASTNVQDALQAENNEEAILHLASRPQLIAKALKIGDKAELRHQYNPALKAIELAGKMSGAFQDQDSDLTQYNTLMQTLIINNNEIKQEDTAIEAEYSRGDSSD